MAKKKKEKITLNGSPLQAITIGVIKENKFGWLGIIFLFALFAGIVFYLPELFEMYQARTSVPVRNPIPLNNTTNTVHTNPPEEEVRTYTFLEKTGFKFDNIDISDITYEDGIFSYKITNKLEKDLDLETLHLIIELYDKDNKSLISYPIRGFVSMDEKKDFTQNVADEIKSAVVAYNIVEAEIVDDTPEEE